MSLRTSETTGQVAATAEKFLSEAASEDGLILSTMPIPMHFTNFPDPVGLSYVFKNPFLQEDTDKF